MNKKYHLVLASSSERRINLLKSIGFKFKLYTPNVNENVSPSKGIKILTQYLSKAKALSYLPFIKKDELVMGLDTLVSLEDKILSKPSSKEEAFEMLHSLLGKTHQVVTSITLVAKEFERTFSCISLVSVGYVSDEDILSYIDNYNSLDKSGGYGVQDLFGMIAIEKIEGSYYNIMGLPTDKVYSILKPIIV